ncbi:MAG TPA: ATP-binding protein [Bacteroidetes bacterium]|nr:ATP-binding protein [Bacteroidota bacterium]
MNLFANIPDIIIRDLQDANPWWREERIASVLPYRRWPFDTVLQRLKEGLASITVLRGPRQVGKTTLLVQMIDELLEEGVGPKRILRVQFDELDILLKSKEPILEIARWYTDNVLGKSLNQATLDGETPFFFFDEVQLIPDWAPQLKHLVDIQPVRVFITGSSALRIEAGRDSLAGRMSTLEMGPLLLREVAELRNIGTLKPLLTENGLESIKRKEFWMQVKENGVKARDIRDRAFTAFSKRGAFPISQSRVDKPWEEIATYLIESVIERVIRIDLRTAEKGRKRDLRMMEEVFRLACRYTGQSPKQALYVNELRSVLGGNVGWQRIIAYLRFLDGSLILKLIEPLEIRLRKRRGPSKLCLCDHALRAAWFREYVPLTEKELGENPHQSVLAGRIAESIAGYFLSSIPNLDVTHFPERGAEPEVDYILTVGKQRIPVEVKYRKYIDYYDTIGLRTFIEKANYNAPFGVLITQTDDVNIDDPRIVAVSLSSFLLMR